MTLKDEDTLGGDAVRDVLFEEDLGTDYINCLANYRKKTEDGNDVKDPKGGYVIDLSAIRNASGDLEQRITKKLLRRVGGMIENYKFDVPRYANNADGTRTLDGNNRPVIKNGVMVFTQLKFMIPNAAGGYDKSYYKGMSPEEKGERIVSQFFREPVAQITTAPSQSKAEEENMEETPF